MEMFDSSMILFLAFMTTAFPLMAVGIVRIMERI
jgi:nitrate reductase NapE component